MLKDHGLLALSRQQGSGEGEREWGKLQPASQVDTLAQVPAESVWLANFVSPCTRETYLNAVREFVAFHHITNPDDLRQIDQAHVIAWRDWLMAGGASPRTVRSRLSAVSSMFRHLCEQQEATRNPTIGVRRPHVDSRQVQTQVLTPQQVRAMLDAPDTSTLKGKRDAAILHIMFYSGCRISEVCSLRVRDFHEDAGYWVLDFTVKGGKQNRIAVHLECQLAIQSYLAAAGHGLDKTAPLIQGVVRGHFGKSIKRRRLDCIFRRYAVLAKLPGGITPHSARASFITQALEAGCPIEAVQRSVGHARINTTQMYDKRSVRHRESASFAVRY